jgi:hypothetical protein
VCHGPIEVRKKVSSESEIWYFMPNHIRFLFTTSIAVNTSKWSSQVSQVKCLINSHNSKSSQFSASKKSGVRAGRCSAAPPISASGWADVRIVPL